MTYTPSKTPQSPPFCAFLPATLAPLLLPEDTEVEVEVEVVLLGYTIKRTLVPRGRGELPHSRNPSPTPAPHTTHTAAIGP